MRRFTIALVTICLTAPFAFADDNDLEYDQLPEAVKSTVDREVGKGKISDIDKEEDEGRTYYEVDYREGKKHMELQISEDGKVLKRKSC